MHHLKLTSAQYPTFGTGSKEKARSRPGSGVGRTGAGGHLLAPTHLCGERRSPAGVPNAPGKIFDARKEAAAASRDFDASSRHRSASSLYYTAKPRKAVIPHNVEWRCFPRNNGFPERTDASPISRCVSRRDGVTHDEWHVVRLADRAAQRVLDARHRSERNRSSYRQDQG